ncbi:alpha/beta hydrolase [bacterium]|nr:MAG: alpha/beta hydrolase [bacterium]
MGSDQRNRFAGWETTMKTWSDYSSNELERLYDNRSAVPDHQEIFRGWKKRSRLATERLSVVRNLAYGPHPRQTLDLFVPADLSVPAPLHVFLHGGYWQAMSKEFFGFVAEGLVQAEVPVAVPNYRLCPEVGIEEIIDDVRKALVWLHHNGTSHGVDARRVQISGHSAGGHMVAMLWMTDWTLLGPEIPADFLHSGIGVSGLYELEPLISISVNKALRLDTRRAREISPALLQPVCKAPLLLAVGETESDEYHRQSENLYEKWHIVSIPMEIVRLKGHHHFSIVEELAHRNGALCQAALDLRSREEGSI